MQSELKEVIGALMWGFLDLIRRATEEEEEDRREGVEEAEDAARYVIRDKRNATELQPPDTENAQDPQKAELMFRLGVRALDQEEKLARQNFQEVEEVQFDVIEHNEERARPVVAVFESYRRNLYRDQDTARWDITAHQQGAFEDISSSEAISRSRLPMSPGQRIVAGEEAYKEVYRRQRPTSAPPQDPAKVDPGRPPATAPGGRRRQQSPASGTVGQEDSKPPRPKKRCEVPAEKLRAMFARGERYSEMLGDGEYDYSVHRQLSTTDRRKAVELQVPSEICLHVHVPEASGIKSLKVELEGQDVRILDSAGRQIVGSHIPYRIQETSMSAKFTASRRTLTLTAKVRLTDGDVRALLAKAAASPKPKKP